MKRKLILWVLTLGLSIVAQAADDLLSSSQNDTSNLTSSDSNSSGYSSTDNDTSLSNSTNNTLTLMETYIQNFPKSVINVMAQRDARYHHYLWHQVRQGWNRFKNETKDAFREIGWEPPNPARIYDENGTQTAVLDNYAGEDFLFMHRRMVQRVNQIIAENNESTGNITGWNPIPGLGDADWPVPDPYNVTDDPSNTEFINNMKTDVFYNRSILPREKVFTDPERLKNMTLNELGVKMETTVHTYIHMRWSGPSELGYRNSYRGTIPYVDPKWDDVNYNWLGDSYASHVHPLFWKIHGWVDERIEDWKKANGISEIIWNGTWTGGPMNAIASVTGVTNSSFRTTNAMSGTTRGSESGSSLSVMDQAYKIFQESGVPESGFTDEVIVPGWEPEWEPES